MIHFHYETDFKLINETAYHQWAVAIIVSENRKIEAVNYIFCDDAYLHKMNLNYLNHNTLTDVISFDYSEEDTIHGDIFISIERVRENAKTYGVDFEKELLRVMAHGVLHYCGYNDKTSEEAAIMRKKEEEKIRMFHVKQF